jgi:hypothetical protein
MSITPHSPDSLEPTWFDSDSEMFEYINNLTEGKFKAAKAAVSVWWEAVTTALYYADVHFGWDALDPDSCSGKVMPLELTEWCTENGLDTPKKISRARAVYRAALLSGESIEALLNHVGVSKATLIGSRSRDQRDANALLNIAPKFTEKQLRAVPTPSTSLAQRASKSIESANNKSSLSHIALTEVTKDLHSITHKISEALSTGESDVIPQLYGALRSLIAKYETDFLTISIP